MYDPKCENLALDFIEDHPWVKPGREASLAQAIQTAIEDWLSNEESNQEITDARTDEDMKTHAE